MRNINKIENINRLSIFEALEAIVEAEQVPVSQRVIWEGYSFVESDPIGRVIDSLCDAEGRRMKFSRAGYFTESYGALNVWLETEADKQSGRESMAIIIGEYWNENPHPNREEAEAFTKEANMAWEETDENPEEEEDILEQVETGLWELLASYGYIEKTEGELELVLTITRGEDIAPLTWEDFYRPASIPCERGCSECEEEEGED